MPHGRATPQHARAVPPDRHRAADASPLDAPRPWRGFWPAVAQRPAAAAAPATGEARGPGAPEAVAAAARRRRLLLAMLTLLSTVTASWLLGQAQPDYGNRLRVAARSRCSRCSSPGSSPAS